MSVCGHTLLLLLFACPQNDPVTFLILLKPGFTWQDLLLQPSDISDGSSSSDPMLSYSLATSNGECFAGALSLGSLL
jgi:hypothetical protein